MPFGRRGAPRRSTRGRQNEDTEVDDPYSYRGGASRGRGPSRSQRGRLRQLKKMEYGEEDDDNDESGSDDGRAQNPNRGNQGQLGDDEEMRDDIIAEILDEEEGYSNVEQNNADDDDDNNDEEEDLSHSEIEDDAIYGKKINQKRKK